jgi:enoyl-CoA hydratase/carnithine racemase
LLADRAGTTLTLTLNRPDKMNALSAGLVEALLGEVERAAGDGTRLVVLRGNGRNFSAGFDFGGFEAASEGDLVLRFIRIEQLLQAVHHAPFDTLALAHGKNFGAGVDLIGSCNRRVASSESTFRMPGLRFGLVLGTRRFAEQVGADRARQVLQAGRTFDAGEGAAWGFVDAIEDASQWPRVVEAAEREAAGLDRETAAQLFSQTRDDRRDADLAALVRSAARPGLKDRIAAYRAAG